MERAQRSSLAATLALLISSTWVDAEAARPRSAWNNGLPALSRDRKQVALPVRSQFCNWVKNRLTTDVHFVSVGKTRGQALPVLSVESPLPCFSVIHELAGRSPDSPSEQRRRRAEDEQSLAQFDLPDRPPHCELRSEGDEPPEKEQARLQALDARLAAGGFQPSAVAFYRRKESHTALTEFQVRERGLSLVVHPNARAKTEPLELRRDGRLVHRVMLARPESVRKSYAAGPTSRVVLDSIDGLLLLPGQPEVVYALVVWADELNGRKVSYLIDEWVALPTGASPSAPH